MYSPVTTEQQTIKSHNILQQTIHMWLHAVVLCNLNPQGTADYKIKPSLEHIYMSLFQLVGAGG